MKYKNSTKGFILKKNFYKDTSVFLEIFCFDFGKKTFFIKNFKKSKKINSAFLNIGSEIKFDFSEKGDVGNITEISFIDGFEALDEEGLKYLSYFLGLIGKFFQEGEKNFFDNEKFFLFLKKFFYVFKNLEKFSTTNLIEGNLKILKIFFEINFLTKVGFLGDLSKYGDNLEKIKLFGGDKNFFNKEKIFFYNKKNFSDEKKNFVEKKIFENKNLDNSENLSEILSDSSVKFLNFLQKNNIENILNIFLEKSDEKKIFHLFEIFFLEHNCKKILKIFDIKK